MLSHAAEEVAGIEAIEETVEVEDEVAEEVKAQDKVPTVPDTRVPSIWILQLVIGQAVRCISSGAVVLSSVQTLVPALGGMFLLQSQLNNEPVTSPADR